MKATFIAGPCVIESAELLDTVAKKLVDINNRLGTDIIFKASFDKANRTSIHSFRGPGIDRGLQMLADVKTKYGERCLVMYRDTRTNELSKFCTDCDEMKQNLSQAKGMGEIPFSTVIAAEYFGDNKVKYKFT